MKSIDESNFSSEVLQNKMPVVIDCWAEWCGPCRMVAPIFEKLAEKYGDKVMLCKINVDECPSISDAYSILSIPTFIAFKDGKEFGRKIGANPQAIEELIKSCL